MTEPWLALRLLDAGASAQADETRLRNPLLAATTLGSLGAARLMLDRGADLWAMDGTGTAVGSLLVRLDPLPDPAADAARRRLLLLRDAGFPAASLGAKA